MNSVSNNCFFVLACGASVSMIILSFRINQSDASNTLVHVADAAKEWAITMRN